MSWAYHWWIIGKCHCCSWILNHKNKLNGSKSLNCLKKTNQLTIISKTQQSRVKNTHPSYSITEQITNQYQITPPSGGYPYLSAWGATLFSQKLEKNCDPPYRTKKKITTPPIGSRKKSWPPLFTTNLRWEFATSCYLLLSFIFHFHISK